MMGDLPSLSIVTPSYNQALFLEDTIQSVVGQPYPGLEYLIVDGGSTDGSVDIIRGHASKLAGWVSEPDGGQYDAVNKGFAMSSGEIMGWINSDDKYFPGALQVVGEIFAAHPSIQWLTSLFPITWDARGRAVYCRRQPGYTRNGFLRGEYLAGRGWHSNWWIQQESTFWRRSLWDQAGGRLDTRYKLAADFELWARFFSHADLYGVETVLGGFRVHGAQKTARYLSEYQSEAEQALRAHGGMPPRRFTSLYYVALARYFPPPLRRKLKFLEAYKVCRYSVSAGEWIVERG